MYPINLINDERPLILASQSPQRYNILKMLDMPFQVVKSDFSEAVTADHADWSPEEIAKDFALQKALSVQNRFPDNIILGVDTLVVDTEGKILGKPKNIDEAQSMLIGKSQNMETVISGIAVLNAKTRLIDSESTKIFFAKIDKDNLRKILSFNEWQERSGAFSIEGKSMFFIKKIDGDYWNVVGLPVYLFGRMLNSIS